MSYHQAMAENKEAKDFNVWMDPGYLIIGDNSFTYDEQYAQFALWSVLKAPLISNMDFYDIQSKDQKGAPKPKTLLPLIKLN